MSEPGGVERKTSDHMPGDGELDQRHGAEGRAGLGEQRLEHLLQTAIERPHDRHALEQRLAEFDQLAADHLSGRLADAGVNRAVRGTGDHASVRAKLTETA
jgi:hypothetical protein